MPNFWNELERERRIAPRPAPLPPPSREEVELSHVDHAITRLGATLDRVDAVFRNLKLPAPEVTVQTGDLLLDEIAVKAAQAALDVGGSKPYSLQELADTIRNSIAPPVDNGSELIELLKGLRKAIDDQRGAIGGLARQYGGSGPSTTTLTDQIDRELGRVTVKNFPADYPDAAVLAELGRRLSQKTGRTYVTKQVGDVTATTTIHTVTAGKTFYLTGIFLSVFNESISNRFVGGIDDDTTRRVPLVVPMGIAGAVLPFVSFQVGGLLEPLQFVTNVRFVVGIGSPRTSIAIVGYEE